MKIGGQGFTHGVSAVLFGDRPAARFDVDSYGQITAVAPAGSGAQKVSVINEGGKATSAESFTFTYTATVVSPGPPPPPPPPDVTRPRGKGKLSASIRPGHDLRPPFRFRITGRLTLPSGTARSAGCTDRLTVRVKVREGRDLTAARVAAPGTARTGSPCRSPTAGASCARSG